MAILDLAAAECRFLALRRAPPDLMAACSAALGPDGAAWLGVARAIGAALDRSDDHLSYHNRHHFCEATLAMGWLCSAARTQGRLGADDAAIGVVAMLGHDIGHDGSTGHDGRLEAASAARVAAIAAGCGVGAGHIGRISDVILATNPALIARNAQHADDHADDPAGLLRMLANEADVLASVLPRLGRRLGDALAAERGLPADRPRPLGERFDFLRLYRRFSPAAVAIGLAGLHADQIAAFARAGGAAALDRRGSAEGWRLFDENLREIRRSA